MKKIFFVCLLLCLFISCKKSTTDITGGASSQSKIYYQGSPIGSGRTEIFSMNEDGSDQKQVTDIWNKIAASPVLSADGAKVIFCWNLDFPGYELFSMNPDGSDGKKIISNNITGSLLRNPFIYQDGQKIVYCLELDSFANRHGEIFTADMNGSNRVSLTNYPADGNCYDPCVDPANTTIVYSNLNVIANGLQLYAMTTTGANKHALTSTPGSKWGAQFSPDGTKIVFSGQVGVFASEIFIMDADGKNMTKLTFYTNNGTKYISSSEPTFSKDGKTIYFSSDEFDGYTSQIYKMNIDGTDKVKITSTAVDKYNPCVK